MGHVIHWNRPAHDRDNRYELRVAVVDGDLRDIHDRLIERILQSETCEVVERGGDYTGPDRLRALWFDVICTLPGHEPMVWEHAVTIPGETWPLA